VLVLGQAPESGRLVAQTSLPEGSGWAHGHAQRVVRLAVRQLGVQAAFLVLINGTGWHVAAWHGLATTEIAAWRSWCLDVVSPQKSVILYGEPVAVGGSDWRFVAGVPVKNAVGRALAVLVLLDPTNRSFDDQDREALTDLAALAGDALAKDGGEDDPGLRLLGTQLPDAALILDGNGIIQWGNRLAEQLFSPGPIPLAGSAIGSWLNAEAARRLDRLLRGASPVGRVDLGDWRDLAAQRSDGCLIPVRLWLSRYSRGIGSAYLFILRDMHDFATEQAKLRTALDVAEHAAAVKSRFLSSISHEFRTPLNSIIGFAEMVELQLQGGDPTPNILEYVRTIADAGRHLNEMVSDVLDLIRLDAGRMVLERRPVDAIAKLRQTLRLLEYQSKRKNLSINLTLPALDKVQIKADGRAYRQCLLNLLANAIKFTPSGGGIDVALTVELQDSTGPKLDIAITDNGIGMGAADLARLGEPFFRADNPNGPHVPGTGLGVAIVFRLVEAMGGTLHYTSTLGLGTVVRMRLPLAEPGRFSAVR